MDEILSININIDGISYGLSIRHDEEETIRKAAKIVNEKISSYKQKYGDNANNFVAMAALHFAKNYIESNTEDSLNEVLEEIRQINVDLDEYIYQNKSKS